MQQTAHGHEGHSDSPNGPVPQLGAGTEDRIPSRVLVAIRYLEGLSAHEKHAMVHHHLRGECQEESVKTPDLDLDNIAARKAACDMLVSFFNGTYVLQPWEFPPKPESGDPTRKWQLIHCVVCGGRMPDCPLCHGSNTILATAAPRRS